MLETQNNYNVPSNLRCEYMNICFVMWGTDRTGGNNAIFHVADRLALNGNKVTVVSAGLPNHGWFSFQSTVGFIYPEERLPKIRWKGKIIPILQLLQGFLARFIPSAEITKHKLLTVNIPDDSDVVIATYYETAFAVQAYPSPSAMKYYYIQHYEPVFFQDSIQKERVKQTYYFPFKWIVSSSWANNQLSENIGKKGLVAIPGSDLKTYYPRSKKSGSALRKIVSLGKSLPIKGLKYLMEAVEMVQKEIPTVQLVLYGNEPSIKDSSSLPVEYMVKPSDEELATIYSNADVVVTPSLFESSPSPPIEAMACGAPLVTTRYGTEDYCFDNLNCLVVPPADSKALADAIIRLLSDSELCLRLTEQALNTVKNLTWDNTAKQFQNAICGN